MWSMDATTRRQVGVGVASVASVALLARLLWPRRQRKTLEARLRRKGVVGQHNFTRQDAAYALYSTVFDSHGVRNIVVASAVFTGAARYAGLLPRITIASANVYIRAGSTFLVFFWAFNYFVFVVEHPVIMYKRTFWNVSVMEKSGIAKRVFRPVFWMANRHMMTIVGSILSDLSWLILRPVEYVREEVTAYDGNVLPIDWFVLQADPNRCHGDGLVNLRSLSFVSTASEAPGASWPHVTTSFEYSDSCASDLRSMADEARREKAPGCEGEEVSRGPASPGDPRKGYRRRSTFERAHDILPPDTPVILILHGIGGTKNDAYVKRFAAQCGSFGWRPVAFSYWRLDWNEWRDMDAVVKAIAARYPQAPLFAVGFSAGAYVLANYLAAVGKDTPLVAAVTCGGCLDFVRTYEYCVKQQSSIYTNVLDRAMQTCVSRHVESDVRLFAADAARHQGPGPAPLEPSSSFHDCLGNAGAAAPDCESTAASHAETLAPDEGLPGPQPSPRSPSVVGALARSYEALLRDVRRASILYDRHLALLPRFTGCPEHRAYGQPPTGTLARGLSTIGRSSGRSASQKGPATKTPVETPRDALDSTDRRDEDWWGGLDDPHHCVYPLPATALHTFAPVRLRVNRIEVATLMIHARDDPIVSHDDTVDWAAVHKNHNLISVRTDRGGHLGWHEGLFPAGPAWSDRVICDYIQAVLGMRAQTQFFVEVVRRAIRKSDRPRSGPPGASESLGRAGAGMTPTASQVSLVAAQLSGLNLPPEEAVPAEGSGPCSRPDSLEDIPPGQMARLCSIPQLEMPPDPRPEDRGGPAIERLKRLSYGPRAKSAGNRRPRQASALAEVLMEGGDSSPGLRISSLDLTDFWSKAMGSGPPDDAYLYPPGRRSPRLWRMESFPDDGPPSF